MSSQTNNKADEARVRVRVSVRSMVIRKKQRRQTCSRVGVEVRGWVGLHKPLGVQRPCRGTRSVNRETLGPPIRIMMIVLGLQQGS